MIEAMLPGDELELLRTALADYTVEGVHERLGWVGQAALARGDLAGVARSVSGARDPLATLIRLFLVGGEVEVPAARSAFAPLWVEAACTGGLLESSAGSVRAVVDIRPYAEQDSDAADWWLVSDFGADVRGGPLHADH